MVLAYVALGANLGDAPTTLCWAMGQLGCLPLTDVVCSSSLYRTAPIDASGPDFFNAVAALNTNLPAPYLLEKLLSLEQIAGRERPFHHAPRTLDLDLLLYGTQTINSPTLQVPHPRMGQRAFVLVPLAEVAPELVSSAQLHRVQTQAITRLGPLSGIGWHHAALAPTGKLSGRR